MDHPKIGAAGLGPRALDYSRRFLSPVPRRSTPEPRKLLMEQERAADTANLEATDSTQWFEALNRGDLAVATIRSTDCRSTAPSVRSTFREGSRIWSRTPACLS